MDALLAQIAADHGTPCFVYFLDQILQRVQTLRAAFDGFAISYAVKSNPNPAILRRLRGHADRLDISSGGELLTAMDTGWPADLMTFTGPGKRDWELHAAVQHSVGEVVLESVAEAVRLNSIAQQAGKTQRVLIRIAPAKLPPGFGVNMSGKPSQFGIDEEELSPAVAQILALPQLSLCGFHIYSGTQCLSADAAAANYANFIAIFSRISQEHDLRPQRLIFGSGLGIPYHEQDHPIDLASVSRQIAAPLAELRRDSHLAQAQLVLELGRYLVGEAGIYLTGITSIKHSRGVDIAICDGGMNHHLGACGHLGSVIHRNYRMFKLEPAGPTPPESRRLYELVGPLCTSIDTLGHAVKLPPLSPGDVIAIHCSGAYGLTASPVGFISHPPPHELLVEQTATGPQVRDITHLPVMLPVPPTVPLRRTMEADSYPPPAVHGQARGSAAVS